MEQRIIELEKKAAFQENLLEDLNGVLIDQQKRMDRLERQLNMVKSQMGSEGIVKRLEDEEPPPHY